MIQSFRELRRQPVKSLKWAYRRLTVSRCALPDFLIIGAQKAGTTSLFNYLSEHPNVARPLNKEPHYFDFHYDRGLAWYRAHFPRTNGRAQVITGEASPYYSFHPAASHRAMQALPDVKAIFLVRDPIERAFSHYRHNVKAGKEARAFDKAVEEELRKGPGLLEEEVMRGEHDTGAFKEGSYLARGLYRWQFRNWKQWLGERLLVIKSEDLYESPEATFARILDFLGLERFVPKRGFERYKQGISMKLDEATRSRLKRFFSESNEALYQELGIDLRS